MGFFYVFPHSLNLYKNNVKENLITDFFFPLSVRSAGPEMKRVSNRVTQAKCRGSAACRAELFDWIWNFFSAW